MAIEYLILFIVLALAAEILGTIGGFGSSLFFVPIAGYFLDFHSVLGVTAVFHVSSNITKIVFFRKGFDLKLCLRIGIPAFICVIGGAILSKYMETKILEIILSVFLILISLFFMFFKSIELKPNLFNSISGGAISGFAAGLVGTGGAVRGMTLAAYNLKRDVFIATSAVIDLGIDSGRGVVYWINGFVHKDDLYLIPILLCVSVAGTYIGKKILEKIPEEKFKIIVLVLVLMTGISGLAKILYNQFA